MKADVRRDIGSWLRNRKPEREGMEILVMAQPNSPKSPIWCSRYQEMLLLGIYPRTAERELKHLVDLGLLIMEGVGRLTVYRIAAQ